MDPLKKTARVAGAWYLSLALTAPFALMYVPAKVIVRGNATATANNILAHETLFRFGIVADLFSSVTFIVVGLMLYRLLSGVNKNWAFLMMAFVLVSAAVGFLNVLNNMAALVLVSGPDFLSAFGKGQLNSLAYLFLRLNSQGVLIDQIFWGLWLLPLGVLVMRSGFLPWILGAWLIANCCAYVAISLTGLLLPPYGDALFHILFPVLLGELAIILWLLIKGAKVLPASIVGPDQGPSHAV